MNRSVKWAAELPHVREVSLFGTADLTYWKDHLREADLVPAQLDGQAQIMILGADSRYLGVPFREWSLSVVVVPLQHYSSPNAAFLVRAFNSCRLFAFCERVLFSTPYNFAEVKVSATPPVSLHLATKGEAVFAAQMGHAREPSHEGEEIWEGPLYLPERSSRKPSEGKYFVARLRGQCQTYSFDPATDKMMINPGFHALRMLTDSNFRAVKWLVRPDGAHAKSQTYRAFA